MKNKSYVKPISKYKLIEIFKEFLKDKINEIDKDGGVWIHKSKSDFFYFGMDIASSDTNSNIGSRLCYEDGKFVGYDIWSTCSWIDDNINIKIRGNNIEFIEDSEFTDFSKEEMKRLYEMIKNVMEDTDKSECENCGSTLCDKYRGELCDEEEVNDPPVPTVSVEFEIPCDYPESLITCLGEAVGNMLRGSGDYRDNKIILDTDNGIHVVVGNDCENPEFCNQVAKSLVTRFCNSVKPLESGADTYHNLLSNDKKETKSDGAGYIKVDAPMKEFATGAKRSDKTGKGLPSLIPRDVTGVILHRVAHTLKNGSDPLHVDSLPIIFNAYQKLTVDIPYYMELCSDSDDDDDELDENIHDIIDTIGDTIIYVMLSAYATDYVYTGADGDIWVDVDPDIIYSVLAEALQKLSIHYELGAQIHGVDNWKKGIPNDSFYNSATRHFFQFMKGMADEKHDVACLWNLFGLMWNYLQETDYEI